MITKTLIVFIYWNHLLNDTLEENIHACQPLKDVTGTHNSNLQNLKAIATDRCKNLCSKCK